MAEKNLNFEQVIERRGTDCLKYDFASKRGLPEGVLPLWVADMDFRISSYIQEALFEQVEHGIYGYTDTLDEYYQAVNKWLGNHYGYNVLEEEIVKTPGVVYAIGMAIQAFTRPGDAVLIQQPVYYPFSSVILDNKRELVSNDLVYDKENLTYHIDFADFEKKIVENSVKLFLLCNPHNPVGRAWNREELIQIGEICSKHGVIVFSDEIHADFVWKGKHQAFLTAKGGFEQIAVTATAPSKTFNLAGMQLSNIIVNNDELKKKYQEEVTAVGVATSPNPFAIVATIAAYNESEDWLNELNDYLDNNIQFIDEYLKENLPKVKLVYPEGTYLAWLDFTAYGLNEVELEDLMFKKANVLFDEGYIFGKEGIGFERINVACPQSLLKECMDRLKTIFENL